SFHYADETMRSWANKDVRLRAELAVHGAHEALLTSWGQVGVIGTILEDVVRDERIAAAATCTPEGKAIAWTSAFSGAPCAAVAASLGIDRAAAHSEIISGHEYSIDVVPLLDKKM